MNEHTKDNSQSIKRVIGVCQLSQGSVKSLNVTRNSVKEVSNRLGSLRSFTPSNRKICISDLIKQTSELDVDNNDDNFQITKTNPLFEMDDAVFKNALENNEIDEPGSNRSSMRKTDGTIYSDESNKTKIHLSQNFILPIYSHNSDQLDLRNDSLSDDDDKQHDKEVLDPNQLQLIERTNSEIYNEVEKLKKEMSMESFNIEIKSIDLLYNFQIVNLHQKYWVGSLVSPTIGNYVHFGDQILSINDRSPIDLHDTYASTLNKRSSKICVKLKRLPYARFIHIENANPKYLYNKCLDSAANEKIKEKYGIKLKANTAKIEKIVENGLFYKNGLKYDPNKIIFELDNLEHKLNNIKFNDRNRLTKWVITEINGDLIRYNCTPKEILQRLEYNRSISVIVQPYDLVKSLINHK